MLNVHFIFLISHDIKNYERRIKIKKIFNFVIFILIINVCNVFATGYNSQIMLSDCEYDFISNMFYEGFQNNMSIEDYNNIFSSGISCNSPIQLNNNTFDLLGTSHTTKSKNLLIKKSCSSNICLITIQLKWLVTPKNKSYDVIGALLENTNFVGQAVTTFLDGNNITNSSNYKFYLNGYGTSIYLSSSEKPNIIQYFNANNSGIVYASYQHSTSQISLNQSQNYSLSKNGYGGVFLFNNNIKPYFDGMSGVSI